MGVLSPETLQQLGDGGYLSKDFLDKVYQDVSVGADEEKQNAAHQAIADDLTHTIQTDPNAQDIAARVATSIPTPSAEPAVTPPPPGVTIQVASTPTATPAAAAPTPVTPPSQPPQVSPSQVQANSDNEMAGAVQNELQGQARAKQANELTTAADVQNANAAKRAAAAGDVGAVKEAAQTGFELQKRGILEEAAATGRYSKQAADFYASMYGAMGDKANEVAAQNQQQKQMLDARIQKQIEAVDNYSKLSIEPNRIYANQSTGDKIAAAIAIGLGSFGRGQNTAIAAMDKAVKDDIELQKSQIKLEGDKLGENQNLIASMIATGHDQREAESLAEAAMYKRAQLKVDEISSNMNSALAPAKAKQLIGQLQEKEQSAMSDALNLAGISITGEASAANINPAKLPKEYRKNIVPGVGIATSPKAATDMLEARTAYKNAMQVLGDIKELRQKNGVETFDSNARVEAASKQVQLAGIIKQMESLGALDKGVENYVDKILGTDPLGSEYSIGLGIGGAVNRAKNAVVGDRILSQIDAAQEYFRRSYSNSLKSRMIYIAPSVKRELLSQPGEDRSNALAGLGKDVTDSAQ